MINFAKHITELRKRAGLTQVKVAAHLTGIGIPTKPYSVSKWEAGLHEPRLEQFFEMCNLYGVTDIIKEFTGETVPSYIDILTSRLNPIGKKVFHDYLDLIAKNPCFSSQCKEKPQSQRTIKLYKTPVM